MKECGKVKHLSRSKVGKHLGRMRKNDKGKGHKDINRYWCKDCKAFHVGHKSSTLQGKI